MWNQAEYTVYMPVLDIFRGENRGDMSLWHGSALLYLFYLHHMATIHHTFIANSDMPQTDIVQPDTDWDK